MGSTSSKSIIGPNASHGEKPIPAYKIVLVGDPQVGKTSMFTRYTQEQFDYSYQPTMQVNIANVTKKVNVPYETLVSVTMWDLPGREEIDLRRSYYKDVDAAIVVVDLSDEDSIDMAGTWRQDVINNSMLGALDGSGPDAGMMSVKRQRKKSMHSQVNIPILLVGNKVDKLEKEEDEMGDVKPKAIELLEEVSKQHNFVGCVSVSSKEMDGGVGTSMRSLVRYLLEKSDDKSKKSKGGPPRLQDIFNKKETIADVDELSYVPLARTRLPGFDPIFEECDSHVEVIEEASLGLMLAVKNFKRACCISGITHTYKASIEDCITGLKETLKGDCIDADDDDVLNAEEKAGYIQLLLPEGSKKPPGTVQRVLDVYNKCCEGNKTGSWEMSSCEN